jgi:predicted phage-related endonuclease
MLTEADLALRRTGITSTDITRLVGESPWGNACDVYAEKIAGDEGRREATLYQRIGHTLEPLVLELISEQFGVTLDRSPTIACADIPWALATPDGVGSACVGEAKVKSVSFARPAEWDDDDTPPAFVVVQATWHCIVKRVPVCYVGALLGAKPKFYIVERDPSLESVLLEEGERFYREHLVPHIPPPVDGTEGARRMLSKLWPKNNGVMIKANLHAEEAAREYFESSRRLKEAEAAKEMASQLLKEAIGEGDGLTGDGWRATLKVRSPAEIAAYTRASYRHFDIRPVKGK